MIQERQRSHKLNQTVYIPDQRVYKVVGYKVGRERKSQETEWLIKEWGIGSGTAFSKDSDRENDGRD